MNKRIVLPGPPSTIVLMEWLKTLEGSDLTNCLVDFNLNGTAKDGFIVSSNNMLNPQFAIGYGEEDWITPPPAGWFEFRGMYRLCIDSGWLFYINDTYYYASK